MIYSIKIIIKNKIETKKLAKKISMFLKPNLCLLLEGPLASGKTTFTKYLLKTLGINTIVTSPTFLIIKQYITKKQIIVNHMDFYRLIRLYKEKEFEMYFEYFTNSINIIEWPTLIIKKISKKYDLIKINISIISEQKRIFFIKTNNNNLKIALEK